MPKPYRVFFFVALVLAPFLAPLFACAQDAPNADKVGRLPHVTFDVKKKQVRVEAEALAVDAPLEFFCVQNGGSEHESVLRTPAKPSHIHTALLAIGLKPGRPVQFSEALKKWQPPQGPPLHVNVEFAGKDGKTVSVPAYRLMRDHTTKKEMKPMSWIYAGSRVMDDGTFAADATGYVISVVNFDLTLIDIPDVASNSNETLEWERNPDVAPPQGTKVTMVIEPAGDAAKGKAPADAERGNDARPKDPKADVRGASFGQVGADATEPAGGATGTDGAVSDVTVDERRMTELRGRWARAVRPHAAALREAAQAHYDVIDAMRREQQRLIDEADRIQRAIDALEKEYQDFTTPRPAPTDAPTAARPGEGASTADAAPGAPPADAAATDPLPSPAGQ
jgi:hypothetical protein